MTDLTDKLILLACCFGVYLLEPGFGMTVSPVIIAVICSCFLSYFEQERLRVLLTCGFIAGSVFLPGLSIFLPLVCYDLLFSRGQFFCLAALIPLVFLWQDFTMPAAAVTTMLLAVCVLLKYRTSALERQKSAYKMMHDAAREMAFQLKQQNKELLEKQDYEINIATLNERNRIAKDIHDNVGHLLSSSLLQVGALLTVNKDEEVKGHLLTVKSTLSRAMDSIRASVHNLYDESVDLRAQIDGVVRKFTFCAIDLDYDIEGNCSTKLKYAFIAIVKEALSNIIRHSDATQVHVALREHPALYQLVISDNGTVKKYDMEKGIGLKNIADRVASFQGNFNISTRDGFEIFISIPKGGTDL